MGPELELVSVWLRLRTNGLSGRPTGLMTVWNTDVKPHCTHWYHTTKTQH